MNIIVHDRLVPARNGYELAAQLDALTDAKARERVLRCWYLDRLVRVLTARTANLTTDRQMDDNDGSEGE